MSDSKVTAHFWCDDFMQAVDFPIPGRPVSLQTKNRQHLQAWKRFVRDQATMVWTPGRPPVSSRALRCSIVYLCGSAPADVDNIVKPIQDALAGVVFKDDLQVSDIGRHRRFHGEALDVTFLPWLLCGSPVERMRRAAPSKRARCPPR
ncbi:RusA family crossover junction endodeoxyribonuclease [Massilia atriviolacea]|uniref:RusA family crossover junction endodeoxyribonuclease n=1 Tax=Massilia atriviolacea TaxID=2495579 RepID=A0A430HNE8_9BURK|nr:RusA family crossover junction endodeoxyribonuclease [Massilia atriviolacea]RSZ59045.1 RusA family crossover junction endodeoxyribonuclease [Massilia atriviolacea]